MGRVIVPENTLLKAKLVLEAHEPLFCGHFGAKKTTEVVSRNWWWPDLPKEVEKIVSACDICQRVGPKRKKDKAPIETIMVEGPWEVVTIDFLSGFVPSILGGWEGCVVVYDRFS